MPRDASGSTTSSPARKRQRLSSPLDDMDDEFDFDSDGLAQIEEIERNHARQRQQQLAVARQSQSPPRVLPSRGSPTRASSSLVTKRSPPPRSRSSSPEHPPGEPDIAAWIDAPQTPAPNASFTQASFSFASGKALSVSAQALEKAAAKLKSWEQEDADEDSSESVLQTIVNESQLSRPPLATPKPPQSGPTRPFTAASQSSQANRHDLHGAPPATPARQLPGLHRPLGSQPAAGFSTPRLGGTPRGGTPAQARRKFTTPFKAPTPAAAARPPQPSSSQFSRTPAYIASTPTTTKVVYPSAAGPSKPTNLFKTPITKPAAPRRMTLVESGMEPGNMSQEELEDLGIPSFIFQINTWTAQYFAFDSDTAPASLDSKVALAHLQEQGYKHATLEWIQNHWRLILWKLSGMVINAVNPLKTMQDRWNWDEVIRQLRYRYKREYVDGSRSPLRKILERDANAGAPLTICVSGIQWHDPVRQENGTLTEATAELEVTDGWYFVRATLDEPLTRAVRRNIIKVGRKIACSGAKLDSPHQEGKDIFESGQSCTLALVGNSTSLAPWHAKLGFHPTGFTAGLRSLSGDGGVAALIDVVITRAFPVGFVEHFADGTKEGPYNEQEERERERKWKTKRDKERARLVEDFEKRMHKAEGIIDKLLRKSGSFVPGEDGEIPGDTEDIYEEILEDASRLKTLTSRQAGWMVIFLKHKCEQEREQLGADIENELASECPERQIRNFRVLRVRDARSIRRPSTRTAQLTVWDALQTGEGALAEGSRVQISNLFPQQPRSWGSPNEPDSEIFLTTRKNSRIQTMPKLL